MKLVALSMKALVGLLLTLLVSAAGAESAYRWVDKSGKVHYSDQPPPAAETQRVEEKRLEGGRGESGGYSYEARRAAEDYPVILFTGPDCDPGCKNARELLRRRGVPFNETSIATPEDRAAYQAATGKTTLSVPTLIVGRKAQVGYDADTWNGLLDTAGYPTGSRRR